MNKQKNRGIVQSAVLKQGIVTLLLGGSVTVALFYLSAVFIVSRTISQSAFVFFATVSICLGCAISSVILALQRKTGGLVCGLICFGFFAMVMLGCGWVDGVRTLSSMALLRLVLLCASACLGGVFGVTKAEKRARCRRKI